MATTYSSTASILGQLGREFDVRRAMLVHAASIFAKKDFHRTNTAELAVRGLFSEGRYYAHFGSKDGILRAIHHEFWREMYLRAKSGASKEDDPVKHVRAILDASIDAYQELDHHLRVTTVTCYPVGREHSPEAEYHVKYRRLVLHALLAATKNAGWKRPRVRAQMFFHHLLGAMQHLLHEHYCMKYLRGDAKQVFQLEDIRNEVSSIIDRTFAAR